ncbi:MAG: DUF4402 domain-containing protein [Alphaproteobacteria bacterium]|nr:DUF4402 domain-containing protein [Alphaproteobacteria bacterium]
MRKYFLTTAAAFLSATNVMAATDYVEVSINANISSAKVISCSNLNFGDIVVKEGNATSTLTIAPSGYVNATGDVVDYQNQSRAVCQNMNASFDDDATSSVQLIRENGSERIDAEIGYNSADNAIWGTLNIPSNVTVGNYIGTHTVLLTY